MGVSVGPDPEKLGNMRQHDNKEKLEEDQLYSAMKLEKYGFCLKLKISDFVSFLAWTGIMVGVLGILFSLELLILPTDTFPFYLQRTFGSSRSDVVFYVLGVVGLVTSAVWLALHLALRKRNVNKEFRGIKKILKMKCYISGTFEILFSIMGVTATILIAIMTSGYQMPREYSNINIIRGGICFLYLVFACCKIHGVRKDNNRYINTYIVFKLINFVVSFALGVYMLVTLQAFTELSGTVWIIFIFLVILISFVFIYYMGAVVVLYNFNHHFNSETNYKTLAFTNQTFLAGNTKSPA